MFLSGDLNLCDTICPYLFPFTLSNSAHIRRFAHFALYKAPSTRSIPQYLSAFLELNKDCHALLRKLENYYISFETFRDCSLEFVLTAQFSPFDELMHKPLLYAIEDEI